MKWKLTEVAYTDWKQDLSGVYVLVNRICQKRTHKEYSGETVVVRVDVMSDKDIPLHSFVGSAHDVRINVLRWLEDNGYKLSLEHAGYIGSEIERANMDLHYIQE